MLAIHTALRTNPEAQNESLLTSWCAPCPGSWPPRVSRLSESCCRKAVRRGGQDVLFGGSQGFCWNEPWPRSLPSVSLVYLMFLHWADGGFHQIQILSCSTKAEHANLVGWPNASSVCAFLFLSSYARVLSSSTSWCQDQKDSLILADLTTPRCVTQNSLFCTSGLAAARLEPAWHEALGLTALAVGL